MFGEWAGRMVPKLTTEFDISEDRALRLTSLIRYFISKPEYRTFDKHHELSNRDDVIRKYGDDSGCRSLHDVFLHNLPQVLRNIPGNTIEERWNNLMDELCYQELADGGVYLEPWNEYNAREQDDIRDIGVYKL